MSKLIFLSGWRDQTVKCLRTESFSLHKHYSICRKQLDEGKRPPTAKSFLCPSLRAPTATAEDQNPTTSTNPFCFVPLSVSLSVSSSSHRRRRRSKSDDVDDRDSPARFSPLLSLKNPSRKKTMEELQKLEKVQGMISFMEVRGLSTNHQDSDRFLAHFLLFLIQPSKSHNMQNKVDLISEHIHKISPTILEDALLQLTEDCQHFDPDVPSCMKLDCKLNPHLSEMNKYENLAMVGVDGMQRANSTLEDFCRSYFMFHGMDVNSPQEIFRFLPVLSFTESYIYQVINIGKVQHMTPRPDSFDPLIYLLHSQGLLTERIRTELQSGVEYWELERKLCHALTGKKKILIEDVMRAVHLKSFDYRVLNLLLYQSRNQQVNDLHMEFLSISEFLVEVSDDLYDYEEDVIENSFNILRMFVGVYGVSTASVMLAKSIADAEKKYDDLSKALDPELSSKYWRRCEEATKEGGATSGHAFGRWSIPPVIVDEESFRLQTISRSSVSPNRNL